jgi:hypothetical protein
MKKNLVTGRWQPYSGSVNPASGRDEDDLVQIKMGSEPIIDLLFQNFCGEKSAKTRYSKRILTAINSVLFTFCELFRSIRQFVYCSIRPDWVG